MRILITTIFKYPQLGGVSTYIKNLSKGLSQKGHYVEILSISDTNSYFSPDDWGACDHFYENLTKQYSEIVPETALKWELFRFMFERLLIKFDKEFDIIHTNDVFSVDLLKKRFINSPVIVTPHASLVEECILEGFCNPGDDLLNYAHIHNGMVKSADGVIAISQYISKRLCSDLPDAKVHLVHTGIPFQSKSGESINHNKVPVITTVTRLVPIKGIAILLDALKKVEDLGASFKCEIIGDGHLKDDLILKSKKLGLKNTEFLGKKNNVLDYLKNADIFVLPSLSENLPIALIEAMFSKCAVVASDVGGVSELITTNKDGILVNPNLSDELANALLTLLSDNQLREEYSSLSYNKAIQKHTLEVMTDKVIEVYKKYVR